MWGPIGMWGCVAGSYQTVHFPQAGISFEWISYASQNTDVFHAEGTVNKNFFRVWETIPNMLILFTKEISIILQTQFFSKYVTNFSVIPLWGKGALPFLFLYQCLSAFLWGYQILAVLLDLHFNLYQFEKLLFIFCCIVSCSSKIIIPSSRKTLEHS